MTAEALDRQSRIAVLRRTQNRGTMDKKTLLDRAAATEEERLLLARVLDKYEQCARRGIPTHTDFLTPAEQCAAQDLLNAAAIRDGYRFLGGYDRAERRMLYFLPEWQETPDEAAAFLRAAFRREDAITHRDLLGGLMGLGIAREKVGDILVGEASADVIVSADVAPFLLREWTGAGRAHLRVSAIEAEALSVPELRMKEIRDTVATLRLDAVTASGFSISRTKAAELIAAGRVQKNARECLKPDAPVAQGDVVSARGLGKFEVSEVGGKSKKGRTMLVLRRYL